MKKSCWEAVFFVFKFVIVITLVYFRMLLRVIHTRGTKLQDSMIDTNMSAMRLGFLSPTSFFLSFFLMFFGIATIEAQTYSGTTLSPGDVWMTFGNSGEAQDQDVAEIGRAHV